MAVHSCARVRRDIEAETSLDLKTTIRRNKLLGMWAAEKLSLVGQDTEAYSNTTSRAD